MNSVWEGPLDKNCTLVKVICIAPVTTGRAVVFSRKQASLQLAGPLDLRWVVSTGIPKLDSRAIFGIQCEIMSIFPGEPSDRNLVPFCDKTDAFGKVVDHNCH